LTAPSLACRFRLLVPLGEERRNNPVFGEKQQVSSLTTDEQSRATFVWTDVVSEVAESSVDVDAHRHVGDARGGLRDDGGEPLIYVVENVYIPYLGDITPPPGAAWMKIFAMGYADPTQAELWPKFAENRGYYGTDFPMRIENGIPASPFILLRSAERGLYIGVRSAEVTPLGWHIELASGVREQHG